ncbi:putative transcriptional regulatory protein FixJ [Parasutterella excrementihominis YIT 11859]|uniref:Response regulator n=4 Tax=Parasutterella excrementihominis TaxID=487175 RepID=A0A6I3S634_9BURK|nr:putative transcriptional regulatory protein FixJ [Parasutterella excrementihominis YIT 11859]MTT72641.1 response regulator [Parasutterella excrementihominis]MTT95853.1 response regulator [Parasutterella excrementihominis]MTU01222.1 response regulator [Parasutterella excrementihominis]MTU05621.1 response regulator [Parasutterella excrementihominis]
MEKREMDPKAIALIRVVDDDRAVSKAIQFLLGNEDWTVQVFSSGEEFLVNEAPSVPGCIILDIQMGGISGIEVHKELIARESEVPIIFLTAHGDIPMAVEAMKEGAAEFLVKPLDPEKLLQLVEKHVEWDIKRRQWSVSKEEAERRVESLTLRERQIVELVLKDLSNQEIAEALKLSRRTIECHRQVAYKKLQVNNVKELKLILEEGKQ